MTAPVRDAINIALKEAMKAREKLRMATLRLMIAAIKDRAIQNRSAGKGEEVEEAEILEILAKMTKQRRESADTYEGAGRLELAEQEREEKRASLFDVMEMAASYFRDQLQASIGAIKNISGDQNSIHLFFHSQFYDIIKRTEGRFPQPFSERRYLGCQTFKGAVDMEVGAVNKAKFSHDILLSGCVSTYSPSVVWT